MLTLTSYSLIICADHDGAEPSANSVAAANLLRLSHLLDRPEWREEACEVFGAFCDQLDKHPVAMPEMVCAHMLLQAAPRQVGRSPLCFISKGRGERYVGMGVLGIASSVCRLLLFLIVCSVCWSQFCFIVKGRGERNVCEEDGVGVLGIVSFVCRLLLCFVGK